MQDSTPMVDQYRMFAEFCEQLAQRDELKPHRLSLIEMARLLRELAKKTEEVR